MKTIKTLNLALQRKTGSEKLLKIGKISSVIAIISLFVFLLAYAGSVLFLSYLSLRNKEIQTKISDLTNKISDKKDIEAIILASSQKISSIDDIISSQLNYPSVLAELISLPIDGISMKTYAISPSGAVDAVFTASNSAVLDNFVTLLAKKDVTDNKYKAIQTTPISRIKDGSLSLGVNFILNRAIFNE